MDEKCICVKITETEEGFQINITGEKVKEIFSGCNVKIACRGKDTVVNGSSDDEKCCSSNE